MRDIILTSVRRVKKFFVAVTLLMAINLAANGRADLIGAILIGYVLAAFYIASTGSIGIDRVTRSGDGEAAMAFRAGASSADGVRRV